MNSHALTVEELHLILTSRLFERVPTLAASGMAVRVDGQDNLVEDAPPVRTAPMFKPIALATFVSGSLDILFAMGLTLLFHRHIGAMLRFVASGPFPAATDWGSAGALVGLVVHFALMAVMAVVFMWLIHLRPDLLKTPYVTAIAYGLLTYFALNWAAVPLRFGTPVPPKALAIVTQVFAHVVLVGIPFVLIAAREFGPHAEAAGAR